MSVRCWRRIRGWTSVQATVEPDKEDCYLLGEPCAIPKCMTQKKANGQQSSPILTAAIMEGGGGLCTGFWCNTRERWKDQ